MVQNIRIYPFQSYILSENTNNSNTSSTLTHEVKTLSNDKDILIQKYEIIIFSPYILNR